MKKFISIILAVTLFALQSIPYISATTMYSSDIFGISNAVYEAEESKFELRIEDINFCNLSFSDSIIAYDYTDNGFVFNSEFFPIKSDNDLIGWVIKTNFNSEAIYQFSVAYIDYVRDNIDENTSFAIIYDYSNCYLYDGTTLNKIGDITLQVDTRDTILSAAALDFSSVELKSYKNNYSLQYNSNSNNSRAQTYISCNVSYVSQNPPSNICWAASVACISNYVYGTNRTAISVAQYWYGTTNYNRGLPANEHDDVLRAYSLNYTYYYQIPSDSVIYRNINIGYPILARFITSSSAHAVVIYGINITGGYIFVMDPEYGFTRANYSSANGYYYVSAYSGVTLTLESAACMTWSS